MNPLREHLIRMAVERDDLRPHLLPLLREAGETKVAESKGTITLLTRPGNSFFSLTARRMIGQTKVSTLPIVAGALRVDVERIIQDFEQSAQQSVDRVSYMEVEVGGFQHGCFLTPNVRVEFPRPYVTDDLYKAIKQNGFTLGRGY